MSLLPLDLDINIQIAESLPSIPGEAVQHGEIFTRPWIVEMILDLVNYEASRDLASYRLVEPACGQGAFLGPIAARISSSCRRHERPLADAQDAVMAFDLLPDNVDASRRTVTEILKADGWNSTEADTLATAWIRQGDYLLQEHPATIDFVVGNPPYIRIEDVPRERTAVYRTLWSTMTGRSDIYVGFFEAALRSLRSGGFLGFICADRWMRNQYGQSLRHLIGSKFAMETTISMHDVDAFEEPVAAYPAITVIRSGKQGDAAVVEATKDFNQVSAAELVKWIASESPQQTQHRDFEAARLGHWFSGTDFWPTGSPARIAVLDKLAQRFPTLDDPRIGARIGIGVATGADKIFITNDPNLVEADRLLPLSMVRDVTTGNLDWSGHYLVNPWDEHGNLVELHQYPRLERYFNDHRQVLANRYIARKNPDRWFKTIDKVNHNLAGVPKLLFPDMKLSSHPVLDHGGLYPHHNLYFVIADAWDLNVLGGILLSRVAEAFVSAYAVRMRGKTLRFQAQYLRRIRIPEPQSIPQSVCDQLADAFRNRDTDAATKAALDAYQLDAWPD
ncbi:Eco57I restriction-modification methylase domain-containing protein [Glycomyces sp. NPDC046736]|uniref:Eco57I restriction-modification methylase domain-containing protein n=1 Tax=Glycomyces sp. NPDC046736 TaxID=3155615 RepID=UPI003409BF6D